MLEQEYEVYRPTEPVTLLQRVVKAAIKYAGSLYLRICFVNLSLSSSNSSSFFFRLPSPVAFLFFFDPLAMPEVSSSSLAGAPAGPALDLFWISPSST